MVGTIWDCKQSLNQLQAKTELLWAWAPFIDPEPYCGLTTAHLASEIYEWGKKENESHWKQVPGQQNLQENFLNTRKFQYLSFTK